ncbi:hypothetical protein FFLO_05436 [Filobasidium floriforme]|uniref:Glycosyl transferase CAP10 domain-containing protein n=1 Tax=Filobasidium floriforme TaxID=5210 RepID=A0A8K0NN75_9TREE|nr:hypothetical protein FFLO_05436 [Filobasidium floriforme]
MAARQLTGARQKSFSGNPHSTAGLHVPAQIRRPRKVLYLIAFFGALYWFSIRHGLGQERSDSFEKDHASHLKEPAPIPGNANRKPIRIAGGLKQVGKGSGAGGIWEGALGNLGLPRVGKKKTPDHHLRDDGYVEVQATPSAEHPIYDLMEQARQKFDNMLSNQSRTLKEVVAEYKRRYGIPPPKGFEAWWKFCVDKDIKIVDDYDRTVTDILPFHALDPATFRKRHDALKTADYVYTLNVSPGNITISGAKAQSSRPTSMKNLIQGFLGYLPEGFEVEFTGSDHDLGSQVLGQDQRERALELAVKGEHFSEDELKRLQDLKRTPIKGWFSACNLDSPANIVPGAENASELASGQKFIHDHQKTFGFCENPWLKRIHGAMHLDYFGRSPSELRPLVVLSKYSNNAEILAVPLQAFQNLSTIESEFYPWEEKDIDKVFWRGSSTGGFNHQRPWQDSHRMRLHLMINGPKGKEQVLKDSTRDVMMPDGKGGFNLETLDEATLTKVYMDVGLSGKPIQCENTKLCDEIAEQIEFLPRVNPEKGSRYKYALDVDAAFRSSRFYRLLTSGSAVFKMTIFPDWNQVSLVPWLHYVPIKPSYDDLYDTAAFFLGPIGPDGEVDTSLGHPALGKQIGEAGRDFAREHWRWEVMQSYMFRVILEYRRALSEDREAMSYKG